MEDEDVYSFDLFWQMNGACRPIADELLCIVQTVWLGKCLMLVLILPTAENVNNLFVCLFWINFEETTMANSLAVICRTLKS